MSKKSKLSTQELIDFVASYLQDQELFSSKEQARKVVKEVLNTAFDRIATEVLWRENEVAIHGYGTFYPVEFKKREITLKGPIAQPKRVMRFRPGRYARVNIPE